MNNETTNALLTFWGGVLSFTALVGSLIRTIVRAVRKHPRRDRIIQIALSIAALGFLVSSAIYGLWLRDWRAGTLLSIPWVVIVEIQFLTKKTAPTRTEIFEAILAFVMFLFLYGFWILADLQQQIRLPHRP